MSLNRLSQFRGQLHRAYSLYLCQTQILPGASLGAIWECARNNFPVYSAHGEWIELYLFDDSEEVEISNPAA